MSQEQLKAFIEKVKGDLNLQERLKAAKSQDDVVSIAKEHGHEFESLHISQLSEEELDGVAGGRGFTVSTNCHLCNASANAPCDQDHSTL